MAIAPEKPRETSVDDVRGPSSIAFRDFDFVDFGCSTGGSMEFARGRLGGVRGLGLEMDPAKVAACRKAGFEAHEIDVSTLDPRRTGTVRFSVLSHFLEHLPSLKLAGKCIESAIAVSDEFVLIRQPYFDADYYLKALGLNLYWSNWIGHKNHMMARDFRDILDPLLARRRFRRYFMFSRSRIADSNDPCLHPLSSPIDQCEWDAAVHGEKPFYNFSVPVYREIGVLIHTRARKLDEKPRRFLLSCDVTHDSQKDPIASGSGG